MTDTKFISHYGHIFRQYFLTPLMLIIFPFLMIMPFGNLYYQQNMITIFSTITTLLLIPLFIFLPIFIKNKSSLIVNPHGVLIKYPFSLTKKAVNILWKDILKIEKDSNNKVIYIVTTTNDIYALDQNLWYRSSKNAAMTNPSLEESDLYRSFSQNFSISESNTIDYNAYKNTFFSFFGNRFLITLSPFFIISCAILYNFHDLTFLKAKNFLLTLNLCLLWSFLSIFLLKFILIKDIRFISAIFIQSIIYTIYSTGIIICAAHQYSVNYIPSQNIVYKLQENSDYRQTWVTEANFPDIVLYGHTYPQYRFLHEKIGTRHNFRIIHGVLDSYDVVNEDIKAVLSKK